MAGGWELDQDQTNKKDNMQFLIYFFIYELKEILVFFILFSIPSICNYILTLTLEEPLFQNVVCSNWVSVLQTPNYFYS